MRRKRPALLTAAALLLAAPARAEASELLAHERYSLDNGLDVILHVDRTLPLVAVDLGYHVGQIHDGAHPGLAHLTEHRMFRGTRDVDDGVLDSLLVDAGALHNAATTVDRTSYHTLLPRNQLPLLLWLESNRMAVMLPALDETKVSEERQTTIDEWRHRISSQRLGGAIMELSGAIYPVGHAWTQATPEMIGQLTIDDVREFVGRYHGPKNATLVIAGDLPEDIRVQVERYFGHRVGGERPSLPGFSLPGSARERRIVRNSEFASNPVTIVHWPSAPLFEPGDAEADIFARLLEARIDAVAEQVAPGQLLEVEVHQYSYVNMSEFLVSIEGTSSSTPELLLELLDVALARMREQPASSDEIARTRRQMTVSTYSNLESLQNRAARMQIYVGAGKSPDWLDEDLARYDEVTPRSLAQLLDETLAPERRTAVLAHPAEDPK